MERLIAGLYSDAANGKEDAAKMLIDAGNYIASSLFILWAGPTTTNQREVLRELAAHESRFPISWHSQKNDNQGWRKMVADLAIGSAGPQRTDRNEKTQSDVVDAVIDLFFMSVSIWANKTTSPSCPNELKNLPELTEMNASELAKRIVQSWETTDPGFEILASGDQAFSTLGRNFKKGIKRNREALVRFDQSGSDPSVARTKQIVAEQMRAAVKQTPAEIRADFTEAITSRLKGRLKASPKKTS